LLSQLLTLYTTPVIYLFFDTMASRFASWRHRRPGGEQDAEAGLGPGGAPAPAEGH